MYVAVDLLVERPTTVAGAGLVEGPTTGAVVAVAVVERTAGLVEIERSVALAGSVAASVV